jgi:hypothetical protein
MNRRQPCAACGAGCTIDDEGMIAEGVVMHYWCASKTAIAIIRALRQQLGMFKRVKVRA